MIEVPFDPIRTAIPLFVALVLLEIAAGRFWRAKVAYEARDAWTSLLLGFGNTVQTVLMLGVIATTMLWVHQFRLFDIPMSAWWACCWSAPAWRCCSPS